MTLRIKVLIAFVVTGAIVNVLSVLGHPAPGWLHFSVYLAAVLLSSGMKIALPKSEGTMSVNFPFILLGIMQLTTLQAVGLAVASVVAQCRFKVIKPFTLVQVIFNVANVATATVFAWRVYNALLHHQLEAAPALAVAASVYFFANTVPVAFIIASDQKTSLWQQWRRDFLWYLPFYLVGAMVAAAANMVGITFGWTTSLLLIPIVYTIYRAYTAQMAIVRDREQHALDTEALHLRTIEGLAMAIEAKDQGTHDHLQRVRIYVSEIGAMMNLDESLMKALLTASFLHDIGKLAVPEHIINKPGKLTLEEFEKMKIHPVVGADILARVRFPYPVEPIVRSHHEAWDGTGYPDGLAGNDIPIGARILSAVDCFDALASERPYRKALPLDQAMAIVRKESGKQFDPSVVDLLESCYLELEKKARVQIAAMEPLKTELLIHRGAAPGAGLEENNDQPVRNNNTIELMPAHTPASGLAAVTRTPQANRTLHERTARAKGMSESASLRQISSQMLRNLEPLIPFETLAVYLKTDDELMVQFIGGNQARAFSRKNFAVGEGLSGWVALSGKSIVNGNPTVEPHYLTSSGSLSATSSAISIPLLDLDGCVFGVLSLYSAGSCAFGRDHLRILQAIEPNFSLTLQEGIRSLSTLPSVDAVAGRVALSPNLLATA